MQQNALFYVVAQTEGKNRSTMVEIRSIRARGEPQ